MGQGFGFALVFWGVSRMSEGTCSEVLWTAFIEYFLNNAADSERQLRAFTDVCAAFEPRR
jgi:hypothetical protein